MPQQLTHEDHIDNHLATFTDEQLDTLKKHVDAAEEARHPKHHSAKQTLIDTGFRALEIVGIAKGSVEAGTILLKVVKCVKTKRP
jgi:hypothetical protein